MGSVRKVHFTDEEPAGGAPVEQVFADNLPGGGVADGSVTSAKIADKAVTSAKIADGVLPSAATAAKAGLVKKAAIAEGADAAAIRTALIAAGIAE